MQRILLGIFLPVSVAILLSSCSKPALDATRWYTAEQVAEGKVLFRQHCSVCHGENAQGSPNWRTALPNGSFPPPPLNGAAHAWHHPLSQLEATIANGGTHAGATMPGFAKVMNRQKRLAVIAAFQDYWDDRTYRRWLGRGGRF